MYHFLFRRITHGASRLQEVLADRVAAIKYGADAFEEGLRHVIRASVEFNHVANREIALARTKGSPLHNLYDATVASDADLERQVEQALSQRTSDDDTHPSPSERFALVRQLKRHAAPTDDSSTVWDLFANRGLITAEMNGWIDQAIPRTNLAPAESVPTFKEVDL